MHSYFESSMISMSVCSVLYHVAKLAADCGCRNGEGRKWRGQDKKRTTLTEARVVWVLRVSYPGALRGPLDETHSFGQFLLHEDGSSLNGDNLLSQTDTSTMRGFVFLLLPSSWNSSRALRTEPCCGSYSSGHPNPQNRCSAERAYW